MSEKKEITLSKTQVVATNQNNALNPYKKDEARLARADCKLCKSKYKDEIEEMFSQQKKPNFQALWQALADKKEDISYTSVRNHLLYHYKIHAQQVVLREYSDDLQRWVDMEQTRVGSVKKRIAMLEREMMILGSEGENLTMEDRRKNAETMKRIADTLLTYQEKLDDYQKTSEPVTIIINQLKIVLTEEMQHVRNDETKQVLANIMNKMQQSMDDHGLAIITDSDKE
jgi:hypothetical protein